MNSSWWWVPYSRVIVVTLLCWSLGVLSGCAREPIAQDLTQQQAYEIIAVLHDSGVDAAASRDRGGKARYTVSVDTNDYATSVAVLHKNNLPSEHRQSFSELISAQGIIPNSREVESLRVDRAMAAELEELLTAHPAVAAVRVVVRSGSTRPAGGLMTLPSTFSMDGSPEAAPSVSVVLQKKVGAAITAEEIEGIVLRAVPGVVRDGVSITIGEGVVNETTMRAGHGFAGKLVPFLMYWRVPRDEYSSLALTLLGCLVMIGGVGAILGYWWGYYHQSNILFDNSLPVPMVTPGRSAAIRPTTYPGMGPSSVGSITAGTGSGSTAVDKSRDREKGT